jgi:hypothetical protein
MEADRLRTTARESLVCGVAPGRSVHGYAAGGAGRAALGQRRSSSRSHSSCGAVQRDGPDVYITEERPDPRGPTDRARP